MSKIFRLRGVEKDGLKYYRERNKAGDYISVDPSTLDYYLQNLGKELYESRATAIQGLVTSVCTTAISGQFLRSKCRRVAKRDIPAEWLEVL
jgi:hypothetical protein